MIAVIKTGGKQYRVSPSNKIRIEKLEIEEGKEVIFDEVLLVEKDGKTTLGTPFLEGVKVIGVVTKQDKDKKVIILKYKPKTRQHTKTGHRQPFTEVEITKIEI